MKTVPFILILALDGSKKSVSCTCHFTSRAEPAVPTQDETGWPLSWSGCFGKWKKISYPCHKSKPQFPASQEHSPVTIPTIPFHILMV